MRGSLILAIVVVVGLVSLIDCASAAPEPTAAPRATTSPLSPEPHPGQIELVAGIEGSHVRVARFLLTHPGRVRCAVITAALTYPHPNPDVPWPYGLGPLEATLHWTDPPAETAVRVYPDPNTWLAGLAVPTTVIVGLNDLEPQLDWPGQRGNNRVTIARYWVEEMNAFAAEHGVESWLELSLIPQLGHSAYGLLPYSQQAMGKALAP